MLEAAAQKGDPEDLRPTGAAALSGLRFAAANRPGLGVGPAEDEVVCATGSRLFAVLIRCRDGSRNGVEDAAPGIRAGTADRASAGFPVVTESVTAFGEGGVLPTAKG